MAYLVRPQDFVGGAIAPPRRAEEAPEPLGFWRRLVAAIAASRRRQAQRELAAFVGRSGGRLTDDMEREMMRRLCTGDWNIRR